MARTSQRENVVNRVLQQHQRGARLREQLSLGQGFGQPSGVVAYPPPIPIPLDETISIPTRQGTLPSLFSAGLAPALSQPNIGSMQAMLAAPPTLAPRLLSVGQGPSFGRTEQAATTGVPRGDRRWLEPLLALATVAGLRGADIGGLVSGLAGVGAGYYGGRIAGRQAKTEHQRWLAEQQAKAADLAMRRRTEAEELQARRGLWQSQAERNKALAKLHEVQTTRIPADLRRIDAEIGRLQAQTESIKGRLPVEIDRLRAEAEAERAGADESLADAAEAYARADLAETQGDVQRALAERHLAAAASQRALTSLRRAEQATRDARLGLDQWRAQAGVAQRGRELSIRERLGVLGLQERKAGRAEAKQQALSGLGLQAAAQVANLGAESPESAFARDILKQAQTGLAGPAQMGVPSLEPFPVPSLPPVPWAPTWQGAPILRAPKRGAAAGAVRGKPVVTGARRSAKPIVIQARDWQTALEMVIAAAGLSVDEQRTIRRLVESQRRRGWSYEKIARLRAPSVTWQVKKSPSHKPAAAPAKAPHPRATLDEVLGEALGKPLGEALGRLLGRRKR